ncbi:Uma2 domain-containing protein [Gammaproteobacteria bacterium]
MGLAPWLFQAGELGIRLEIVNGLPMWEAQTLYRHQKHITRIAHGITKSNSVSLGCDCVCALDVYIQFPMGLKRPDISIFCREPSEGEQDSALTMIPEAVIEVVSKGYEAKDLEIAPPFYLSQGVKDVVVFDPSTFLVLHAKKDETIRKTSPVEIDLACGCKILV